jgi:hypothetical protein
MNLQAEHDQYMNCNEIADYLVDIINTCGDGDKRHINAFNGQKFRTDTEYSVLVAGTAPEHC